ncbi:uncharacterized protein LOC110982329 [Acanthaster planci]|uniref:Uncharacterized protein LOC110982329 n=1 Tax=Acanthaster planci TaxID=133434 RepID=A0A8B7YYN9_ACAPL|nr:uncharacterized protein LOC110982329 [Acanthaster planci]
MANMYEKVVEVISAAPADRDDMDIDILLPWFRRKAELFISMGNDVIRDIIKNCEFRRHKADDVILRQGDKGHSFFVVLNGSISVYIASDADADGDEDESTPVFTETQNAPRHAMEELGVCVRTLGPGSSFGELALIDSGSVRKASVVANEPSDFIVVDRDLYSRSLKFAQKRDLEEKTDFVNDHPLFKAWKSRHKSVLAMSLTRKRALFGNRLAQQGCPVSGVLFVLRGQAKVSIAPWKQPHRQLLNRKLPKPTHDTSDAPNDIAAKAKIAPYNMNFDVYSIGPGDMIGDIEICCDLSDHAQTVTCLGALEAFELDLDNFHKLITKKNPMTLDQLRMETKMKLIARALRAQNEGLTSVLDALLKKISLDENEPLISIQEDTRYDLWMTQRGPIIDSLGPGSLYYRTKRLDEKLRRRKERREQRENGGDGNIVVEENQQNTKLPNLNLPKIPATSDDNSERNDRNTETRKQRTVLPATFQVNRILNTTVEQKTLATAVTNPEEQIVQNESSRLQAIKSAARGREMCNSMQQSSSKRITFEKGAAQHKATVTRQHPLNAPGIIPSYLHLHNRYLRARQTSQSSLIDRWVRSAPTVDYDTVGLEGLTELQVLRRQYSADEYKSLKEKLRLQEKRHVRYLSSLW